MPQPKYTRIDYTNFGNNEISSGLLIELGFKPIGNNTYERRGEKVVYDGVYWWKDGKKIKTVKDL